MSLSNDCENAILEYAPLIRQTNATLLGEHAGFIAHVLLVLRTRYYELEEAGETTWSIPDALKVFLSSVKSDFMDPRNRNSVSCNIPQDEIEALKETFAEELK